MTSKPLMVAWAVFRADPRTGFKSCFSLPWPTSITLFRYLAYRCSVSLGHLPSFFSSASAAE